MNKILKGIMKREKVTANKLAGWLKRDPRSVSSMIRGDVKLDASVFNESLELMGYKLIIVKKEDIV